MVTVHAKSVLSPISDGDALLLDHSWATNADPAHAFNRRIVQSVEFLLTGNFVNYFVASTAL